MGAIAYRRNDSGSAGAQAYRNLDPSSKFFMDEIVKLIKEKPVVVAQTIYATTNKQFVGSTFGDLAKAVGHLLKTNQKFKAAISLLIALNNGVINMDQVEAGDYSAFSEQPTMNYNDSGIIGGITGAVTGGTAAISASQSLGKGGSNPISGIIQAAANAADGLASIGNSVANVINALSAPTLAQQKTEQVQQQAVASEETGQDSVAVSLADALGAKGGASAGSGASVASGAGGAGGGGSSTMLIIGGIVVVGVIFAFVLGSPHSSGAAKAMGGAVIPPIAPSSIAPPLNPATAAVPPISLPTAAELTSSNVPGVSGIPSITNSVTSKTI